MPWLWASQSYLTDLVISHMAADQGTYFDLTDPSQSHLDSLVTLDLPLRRPSP
jgi:hypothetical protein